MISAALSLVLLAFTWAHEMCLDFSEPLLVTSSDELGICAFLGFEKTFCTSSDLGQIEIYYNALSFQSASG